MTSTDAARDAVSPLPRLEHDLLGDLEVPDHVYWGVHTQRALHNFVVSGTRVSDYPEMVIALACVKQAAAQANRDLGLLPDAKAEAIIEACEEVRRGNLHDQFVVDVIQGGAGTSTNMNANEVIANRALEILGHPRGAYTFMHPLDDVNRSQSTNDVYPTAVKIAIHISLGRLLESMASLQSAFGDKSVEFADVLKMGRTQLQDAVPMTLGQEFATYAVMLREDIQRVSEARDLIREINLGASAIGTGITTHPAYAGSVCAHLTDITDIDLATAPDLVEATQDVGAFVQLSGVLKRVAVKLSKTCNDLRLLSSGPRAGLAEIHLPAVQAGSSIMPGKVNPVIPELVNQIAFEAIGNDMTVTMAAEAGQLQLNAFEPIIMHSLLKTVRHLTAGISTLSARCVTGITVDRERLRQSVEQSIGLVTALIPFIGYTVATQVAAEALDTGQSVYALVLSRGLLEKSTLEYLLRPENLTRPIF